MALWNTTEDEIFMGDTFNRDELTAYCGTVNCINTNTDADVNIVGKALTTNSDTTIAFAKNDNCLAASLVGLADSTGTWNSCTTEVQSLNSSLEGIKKELKQLQETVFGIGKNQYEAAKRENARRNKYKTLNPEYEVLK